MPPPGGGGSGSQSTLTPRPVTLPCRNVAFGVVASQLPEQEQWRLNLETLTYLQPGVRAARARHQSTAESHECGDGMRWEAPANAPAPPDEVASSSGEASAAAAAAPPATFQEKSAAQIIEMIGEKIEEMAVGGDEGDEAEGEVPGLQAAPPAAPTPADDNLEDLD